MHCVTFCDIELHLPSMRPIDKHIQIELLTHGLTCWWNSIIQLGIISDYDHRIGNVLVKIVNVNQEQYRSQY
jgi:hypothetical protein